MIVSTFFPVDDAGAVAAVRCTGSYALAGVKVRARGSTSAANTRAVQRERLT